jgi:hypothetical protein
MFAGVTEPLARQIASKKKGKSYVLIVGSGENVWQKNHFASA